MNYEKTEREFYERFWKNLKGTFSFDKTHFSSEVPDKEILDFIKILKRNNFSGKILDIGCGNSRNGVLMSKYGFKVSGIEFSPEALKLSRMNAKMNKVKISFKEGNFLEKNYRKNEFEACIDFGLFHHLRKYQQKKYLDVLDEILKPGGFFYLKVFSVESGKLPKFTPPPGRKWMKKKNHYNYLFGKEEIEKIFGKKFKIVKVLRTSKGRTLLKFWVFFLRKK